MAKKGCMSEAQITNFKWATAVTCLGEVRQ